MDTGTVINEGEDEAEVTDGVNLTAVRQKLTRPFKKLFGQNNDPQEWDESDEYDFTHPVRGTVVIFNMVAVKDDKGETKVREGTNIDGDRLKETFKHLGFTVCYKENQTKEQVMTLLKKEAKRDHSKEDCFACVILTHGGSFFLTGDGWHKREERIMATDAPFFTSDMIALFQDSECKSLKGKPKLFFIQACRGDEFDAGVNVHVEVDETDARPANSIEYTPCPIYKDFLVMYATPPDFYAFRHPEKGSWFVQALCDVLSSPGVRNRTLHQLLTVVIKRVSLEYEAQALQYLGNKQTPCFLSMLVKDVYFRPKTKSFPL